MRDITSVQETVTQTDWRRTWQEYKRLWCPGLMKDVTGVQYKRLWPTWSDEGCDRCTVQKTVTYLVWWRMWQVYSTKDCDLPGLMKDVTGVQYKRLWPTWTDEGCDRCTVQKTDLPGLMEGSDRYTKVCDLPGLMKDVTGVQYKRLTYLVWWKDLTGIQKFVTYLDWWRMWQVYSTKDWPTWSDGRIWQVYKSLWPTWTDEGCDRCTVQKTDLPGLMEGSDRYTKVCDLPGLMKDVTGVQYKRLTYLVWWKDLTGIQKFVTYLDWWRMWQVYSTKDWPTWSDGRIWQVYKSLWPTWTDEGCDRCTVQKTDLPGLMEGSDRYTKVCDLPGLMKDVTGVQYKRLTYLVWWKDLTGIQKFVTYLDWWRMWQVYSTKDWPTWSDGRIWQVYKSLWPTWTDEGCDRCIKEQTVSHLDKLRV